MRLCQNWELTPLTLCATSPKTGEDYSSFTLTHSLSAASALLPYLRFPTLLLKFWIKVRQSIIKTQGALRGSLGCLLLCRETRLSAVEVAFYDVEHFVVVTFKLFAESEVVVRTEFVDNAVDHRRAKYVVFFKYFALTFKTVSRCSTAVGKLCQ